MDFHIDALIPAEIARKAEDLGVSKASIDAASTFMLAVLAGAFIGLGALFYTVATTGLSDVLPFGIVQVVGGLSFCLGLILVVVAGAELFTGNNLVVMAWASRKISLGQLLRNWTIVYVGNFVGAFATALLVFGAAVQGAASGAVGQRAVAIAEAKASLGFTQAFFLGVLCNTLVCLAIWLCLGARSTTDKILSILFPITAFVAAGFEHSIANMYFIPSGMLMSGSIGWSALLGNLIPVTLGNIVGGSLLVGLVYWVIYLRSQARHV